MPPGRSQLTRTSNDVTCTQLKEDIMSWTLVYIRNPYILKLIRREQLHGGDRNVTETAQRLIQESAERHFAERHSESNGSGKLQAPPDVAATG